MLNDNDMQAVVCCSVLQYVAAWVTVLRCFVLLNPGTRRVLAKELVCRNLLQLVAACCSLFQLVAGCSLLQWSTVGSRCCTPIIVACQGAFFLQCVTVCCNVLQRVAACCCVLLCCRPVIVE